MKRCPIARADDAVPLTDETEGTPWAAATPVELDEYPWSTAAATRPTVVRALYDETALYLQFVVEGGRCEARTTELNGPVWKDSCVELFATPEPRRRPHYFNFEVNCVGAFHLGFGPDRADRALIDPDLAEEIRVETSAESPTTAASPDDDGWWVAAALPFETLSAFTGASLSPEPGTAWLGNFHRLGGTPDPEYAAWNPVEAPEPDFHRPADFGRLVFE